MHKKTIYTAVILLIVAVMMVSAGCGQAVGTPAASEKPAEQTTAPAESAAPEQTEQPAEESAAPAPDAPPASDRVSTEPSLPDGQEAYIHAEYGNDSSQYQMFMDYMDKEGMQGELVYVAEIDAYDSNANDWVGVKEGTYNFSLPFPLGKDGDAVIVLQSNSMTGGTITHPSTIAQLSGNVLTVSLQDAAEGTNVFGLGLFGFFIPKAESETEDTAFLLNTAEEVDGVISVSLRTVTLKRNAENMDEITPEISGDAQTYTIAGDLTVTVPDPEDFSMAMDITAAELPDYISQNAAKFQDSLLVNATISDGAITALAYIYTP